ncbi:aminopeptidase P1-like isoform X6 [Camellia sinensis]|uniref:aminopeptidase P1-like isoform X6 n=1 Tax=Camellia sinensis TaxID=4442 RepID=UPI001036182A|nr:aminopeptidase P1-like isoform X6 [Camellia sinensis]
MKYLLYMKNVLRALDFVVLIFGEILDIYLLTNLQMQEIYGASGYFIEAESMNKKKCLETIKLTKLSTSDKLEGFCASKELLACCCCRPRG